MAPGKRKRKRKRKRSAKSDASALVGGIATNEMTAFWWKWKRGCRIGGSGTKTLKSASLIYMHNSRSPGWSVGRSFGPLVRWSICQSVGPLVDNALAFRRFLGDSCIAASAQQHATTSAVHPALFQSLHFRELVFLNFYMKKIILAHRLSIS